MSKLTPLQLFNNVLLAILLFFGLLYLGAPFLIPLALGGLFSMLLLPVCKKLEQWKVPRGVAVLLSVMLVVIGLALITGLLYIQINQLINDLPQLQQAAGQKLDKLHEYIADVADIPRQQQRAYMQEQLNDFFQSLGGFIRKLFINIGRFIVNLVLVIVYTFLFLYYRHRLYDFVMKLISSKEENNTETILEKITSVANSYISGVFLVVLILSVINSIGLTIIGIEHAVFFGLLAGLLNIIPYVGSITGSLIPVVMAFLTKDSLWYPVIVAVFFMVVQHIESYYLTPGITGSKVRLNPFATIVILLLGALVWGVAGMILFIPYLAIAKIIFDHSKRLKPFGFVVSKESK